MEDCTIGATDGTIGQVKDFYIGQRNLIRKDPSRLPHANAGRNSPDIDKPVSRQQQMGYLGYYAMEPIGAAADFAAPAHTPTLWVAFAPLKRQGSKSCDP